MKKTVSKIVTGLLSLSMATTLFAGVPAKAKWDEEQEKYYGLLAPGWIDSEWDDAQQKEKMVTTEDGFPAYYEWDDEGNGHVQAIEYQDAWIDVSLSGSRHWFDYKKTVTAEPVHVMAEDLQVRYYGEEWPEEGISFVDKSDLIKDDPDQKNWKGIVDFFPDEPGFYTFSYGDKFEEAIITHVGYPEIGFYSDMEQNTDNLLLNPLSGNSADYTLFKGDNVKKEVYLHLDSSEDREITLANGTAISDGDEGCPAFELELYGGPALKSGEDALNNYMTVEELNDGWYKLIFANEMLVKENPDDAGSEEWAANGFTLHVNAVKTDKWKEDEKWVKGEPYYIDAWFDGRYQELGLYAQVEGENRIYTEEGGSIDLEPNPNHLRVSLGKTTLNNNGIPKMEKLTTEELKAIIVEAPSDFDEEGNPTGWEQLKAGDAYDCTQDGDYLDFVFYYQNDWYRIRSKDIDGSVRIAVYLPGLGFFRSDKRPADEERIENMLLDTKVYEGQNGKVYALAWIDQYNYRSILPETIEVAAYNVNGKEVPSYVKKGSEIKGAVKDWFTGEVESKLIGYEIEIADQAKEDFDIVVSANYNGRDGNMNEDGEMKWDVDEDLQKEKYSAVLHVDVIPLKELKIATASAKTTYTEGEKFDAGGMVVKAVYEDGKEETVTGYMVQSATLKATDTSVSISYLGKTVAQSITVKTKTTAAKKGTVLTDRASKAKYTVTSDNSKNPTVAYKATTDKKAKSITIPASVSINGVKYKVTSIANNAFKGNKKITKVTIGSNVEKIGKNVFNGCKKLKTLMIKTKKLTAKSVAGGAFKGINKKVSVKVPKKKAAAYKKLLKKKGLSAKAKISGFVKYFV